MTGTDDTTQPTRDEQPATQALQDQTAGTGGGAGAAGAAPAEVTPEEAKKLEALLDQIEGQDELEDSQVKFTDSFGLVLLLLVATYFVTAIAGEHQWGRVASLVLLAATTWLALRASHVRARAAALGGRAHPHRHGRRRGGDRPRQRGDRPGRRRGADRAARGGRRRSPSRGGSCSTSRSASTRSTARSASTCCIAMLFASVYAFTAWVQGEPFFSQIAAAGPRGHHRLPVLQLHHHHHGGVRRSHGRLERRPHDGRLRGGARPAVPDHRDRAGGAEPRARRATSRTSASG